MPGLPRQPRRRRAEGSQLPVFLQRTHLRFNSLVGCKCVIAHRQDGWIQLSPARWIWTFSLQDSFTFMLAAHASLDEYVMNWFGLDKSSGIQTLSIWPRYQLLTLVQLRCSLYHSNKCSTAAISVNQQQLLVYLCRWKISLKCYNLKPVKLAASSTEIHVMFAFFFKFDSLFALSPITRCNNVQTRWLKSSIILNLNSCISEHSNFHLF